MSHISGNPGCPRNTRLTRRFTRDVKSIDLSKALQGAALAMVKHTDETAALYVFLPPNYDRHKIPALQKALRDAGFLDEETSHPSLNLPHAQGHIFGIAVNKQFAEEHVSNLDCHKINYREQVYLNEYESFDPTPRDQVIQELKKVFPPRGATAEVGA